MATIFRPPIITRIPQATLSPAVTSQPLGKNIALTKAAIPVGTTYDRPNPRGPSWTNDRGFVAAPSVNLRSQDVMFGTFGEVPDYDWPNPGRKAFSQAVHYTQSLPLLLLGQGRMYGAPGEVPAYQWPNPKLRDRPTLTDPPNLLIRTLARPVGKASATLNPDRKRQPIADTFVNLLMTTLARPIGRLLDWPNPLRRTTYTVPEQDQQGRLENPLRMPIGRLLDWPTRIRGPIQQPDNQRSLLVTTLARPIGRNTDWPNSMAARQPTPDFAPLRLHGTTLARPVGKIHTDNPLGRPFPISLRGFAQPLAINLYRQDTFFYGPGRGPNYAWPNPLPTPPRGHAMIVSPPSWPLFAYALVPLTLDNRDATGLNGYGQTGQGGDGSAKTSTGKSGYSIGGVGRLPNV